MHIYTDNVTKKEVHSVTTILQLIKSAELMDYANFLGFKHIRLKDDLEKRAKTGTFIHKILECYLNNEDIGELDYYEKEMQKNILSKFTSLMESFGEYESIHTEYQVVSSDLGYGGTIDWIVNINGRKVLADFKSSSKVRDYMLLQLGGYYNLCKKHNIEIDAGMIIIINERTCTHFPISKDTLEEMGELFTVLSKYYYLFKGNKTISSMKPDIDIKTKV